MNKNKGLVRALIFMMYPPCGYEICFMQNFISRKAYFISAKGRYFTEKRGISPLFYLATATAAALSVVVITTATTTVAAAKSVHTITAEEPEDKENDNPCAAVTAKKSVITSHHLASLLRNSFLFLSH